VSTTQTNPGVGGAWSGQLESEEKTDRLLAFRYCKKIEPKLDPLKAKDLVRGRIDHNNL
jgi:hypothetical protein